MKKIIFLACVVILFMVAVLAWQLPKKETETDIARQRAEALLTDIRQDNWDRLPKYVHEKDDHTSARMGIVSGDNREIRKEKIAAWFKGLYKNVKPEHIVRARKHKKDENWMLIEYWHSDLDGFVMKRIEGQWYYTLGSDPVGSGYE